MPEPSPSLPRVAAVILAAGESSRRGQPKQLVTRHGEPLLCRAVRLALTADCAPVVVVLGAAEEACRHALAMLQVADAAKIRIVSNPRWREGMSTSLQAGVADLTSSCLMLPTTSLLVMVTDQARLTTDSLRALLSAHAANGAHATAARYAGRLGVPALFRPDMFPALAALRGDQGARHLLAEGRATAVDLPEAAFEVDTADDLAALAYIDIDKDAQ